MDKAGGTFTGIVDHGVNKVTSTYVPLDDPDLVNKLYVDGEIGAIQQDAIINSVVPGSNLTANQVELTMGSTPLNMNT